MKEEKADLSIETLKVEAILDASKTPAEIMSYFQATGAFPPATPVNTCSDFKEITDSLSSLLEYKNQKYGNSAMEPLNVFEGKCKVGQRLDDKLSRVKNSSTLRKNDVADLIGYLILTCKENGWTNFDELKD